LLTPEQNKPTLPRHIARAIRLAGSEKSVWPVTALLHEALHLPGIRQLARSNEFFDIETTHAVAQHSGSLNGALTFEVRYQRGREGWTET
jgi:hypothetical protein